MYYSKLFSKTKKEAPRDADTINHRLLTQAGYVDQVMAGVYTYLPLGLRVLRKIENIVREEMNAIGSSEVLMPVLHPKNIWETTGGWDNIDVLFKINSRTGKEYALGQSEEEVVTPLVQSFAQSYKNLPISVYQIHWKFRDELRAKSGIMRGREFLMKDMYSFHETEEDFLKYYEIAKEAYLKAFARAGLVAKVTEASGGSFSTKISYEFMVLTDAGEDDILYCDSCSFCVNTEIAKINAGDTCDRCNSGKIALAKASEVGNVFDLGQKYAKDFEYKFMNATGEYEYPTMGCYGIGISRLMGVIVETCNDDKGIVWPANVAPFDIHLVSLNSNKEAEDIYRVLQNEGFEVLFDDREDTTAGEKFKDADLIGIPKRVTVSKRSIEQGGIEITDRKTGESRVVSIEDFVKENK